jgi:hypothetical protein
MGYLLPPEWEPLLWELPPLREELELLLWEEPL